jgi:hypothetical protein
MLTATDMVASGLPFMDQQGCPAQAIADFALEVLALAELFQVRLSSSTGSAHIYSDRTAAASGEGSRKISDDDDDDDDEGDTPTGLSPTCRRRVSIPVQAAGRPPSASARKQSVVHNLQVVPFVMYWFYCVTERLSFPDSSRNP